MRRTPLLLAALLAGCGLAQAAEPIARVRVAFDRKGVTATQVHGLADVAAGRALTADDPARIASVTKLLVAIGVMRLVEQGKLSLDADASRYVGYPLRNPAFPDRPITLRMLLSHTSSVTDGAGYWAVPLDTDLRSLTGDPRAWDVQHPPGTFFRYSNLNFPIIAGAMERATGQRFDRLMLEQVIRPLGLKACPNWSGCDAATVARAVVLYDADGKPQRDDLHGQLPDCLVPKARDGSCDVDAHWRPGANGVLYAPQGGMRISANDLARVGRMLLGNGKLDGVRVLTRSSVRTLTTPVWTFNGHNGAVIEEDEPDRGGFFCRYGLAMQHLASGDGKTCRDNLFGDGRRRIGHSGNAYGLLSGLWIDPKAGTGVAYFATGASNASNGAQSAFSSVEEGLARGR